MTCPGPTRTLRDTSSPRSRDRALARPRALAHPKGRCHLSSQSTLDDISQLAVGHCTAGDMDHLVCDPRLGKHDLGREQSDVFGRGRREGIVPDAKGTNLIVGQIDNPKRGLEQESW